MTKCRNMEALIAASLYESLAPDEHAALQRHLADCAACRGEHASLQALVGCIPSVSVDFQGDLLPAIREELRRTGHRSWFPRWMRGVAGFAFLSTVIIGIVLVAGGKGPEAADPVARVTTVDGPLAEARRLTATDDAAGALKVLKAALAAGPGAAEAGSLQLEVAELEYSRFHRYEAAYNAYKEVREGNPAAWTQSPGIVKERYDLLTEARAANFEPLYQIDAAVKQGEDGMPVLEQVMARYPGRFLAQAAVETMVAMADGEGLDRLEVARSRCSNPVAVAQLDVRLGEGYCAGDLDPVRGKALLHSVAESPYAVPAQMAKDVLARLEAGEK